MKYLLALFLFLIAFPIKAETLTVLTWATGQMPYANTQLIVKYLQKYLPDIDNVVIKVVPGAGSLAVANYLYNNYPDGNQYVIGTFIKSIPLRGMLDVDWDKNIKFDIKKFIWLGSSSDGRNDPTVLISHKPLNEEIIIGEQNSSEYSVPDIMMQTTNLKIKKVTGYKNLSEIRLAFERKEIDAFLNGYESIKLYNPNFESKFVLQYGFGLKRHAELSHIPTLAEISSDKNKITAIELSYSLSKPYVAPPNISKEKAALLRAAFEKVVKDPDYLLEAKKLGQENTPILWQEIEEILNQMSKLKSSFPKPQSNNL